MFSPIYQRVSKAEGEKPITLTDSEVVIGGKNLKMFDVTKTPCDYEIDMIGIVYDADASESSNFDSNLERESPSHILQTEVVTASACAVTNNAAENVDVNVEMNVSGIEEDVDSDEEAYQLPSLSSTCAMTYAQNASVIGGVKEDSADDRMFHGDCLNSTEESPLMDEYKQKEYQEEEEKEEDGVEDKKVVVANQPKGLYGNEVTENLPAKSISRNTVNANSAGKTKIGEYEESENAQEVLYWRQEVIQQHMERYSRGALNPEPPSHASSYSISAGFEDTALIDNPYATTTDEEFTRKKGNYINFFTFKKKFFNENGKEIVQILKIWILPFWKSFQFLARFLFITMPFFGLNLLLEFNYLLLRIAKRIAVFWFESMLYVFLYVPYAMAKSSVRLLFSLLFNAPTRLKEYTKNGIKIVHSIKNKVNKLKTRKMN